jgi:hypothetical protein
VHRDEVALVEQDGSRQLKELLLVSDSRAPVA